METIICDHDDELISAITEYLESIISKKVGGKENISLGLSGGSVIDILSKVLMNVSDAYYKHIHFFFCDERFVSEDSDDLTYKLFNENLFSKRKTTDENVHKLKLHLTLKEATLDYKLDIGNYFKLSSVSAKEIPKFDVLFLGLGPDGHTASLFPNHPLLKDRNKLIDCLDDSPKPPKMRVTMTLPLINSAHNVCFIAVGESKANIVKECINEFKLGGNESYPSSMVQPYSGHLIWFLNTASARLSAGLK